MKNSSKLIFLALLISSCSAIETGSKKKKESAACESKIQINSTEYKGFFGKYKMQIPDGNNWLRENKLRGFVTVDSSASVVAFAMEHMDWEGYKSREEFSKSKEELLRNNAILVISNQEDSLNVWFEYIDTILFDGITLRMKDVYHFRKENDLIYRNTFMVDTSISCYEEIFETLDQFSRSFELTLD